MNKLIAELAKSISMSLLSPQEIKADITLKIKEKLFGQEDFSALGYYAGEKYKGKKLNFIFQSQPNKECIKVLSASLSVFEIPAFSIGAESENAVEISFPEIDSVFRKFSSEVKPDFIILGFPYASSVEFQKIGRILNGKKLAVGADLLIFTRGKTREELKLEIFETDIRIAGGKVITESSDLSAFESKTYNCLLTNSALAAHKSREYGVEAKLKRLNDIVKSVLK